MSSWENYKKINDIVFLDVNPSSKEIMEYRKEWAQLNLKENKLHIGEFIFVIYSFNHLSIFQIERACQLFSEEKC